MVRLVGGLLRRDWGWRHEKQREDQEKADNHGNPFSITRVQYTHLCRSDHQRAQPS